MKEEGTSGTSGTQSTTEWPPGRAERGGRAQHYFITGLPRSRTSWLANWFTWEQSLCFHDGLHGCDSVTALEDKMAAAGHWLSRTHRGKPVFVGNSDSALPLVWPRVLKFFPDAKWVIVLRDTHEAAKCFVKFFTAYPYIGQPLPNLADTIEVFEHARDQLRLLGAALPAANLRCIDVRRLDSLEEIEALWHFVFDGCIRFPADRWQVLQDLMINPMSPKITMDVEAYTKLMALTEPEPPGRPRGAEAVRSTT